MALQYQKQRLIIICTGIVMAALIIPNDDAVATIITKYIFPSIVAGVCFGVSIMTAIDLARAEFGQQNNQQEGKH